MTTAPRPGAHLAAARHAPETLRAEVEPLLDRLDASSTDLGSMETVAAIAEQAHQILSDGLSGQEVR